MAGDGGYKKLNEEARRRRFDWVEARLSEQIKGRKISATLRREMWCDLTDQAFNHIPRPDPFEGGWTLPKNPSDPLSNLAATMKL